MKKDNIIKILMVILIALSVGIIGVSAKLISIDNKKINLHASQDIESILEEIQELKEEILIIKNLPVKENPIEVVEGDPLLENPEIQGPTEQETIKDNSPHEKDDNNNNNNDDDSSKIIVNTKFISKEEAIEIAMKKVGPGGILVEIEPDLDDNPPKYELEIILGDYEYEIEIHAVTGAVIDFDKDEVD